MQGVIEEVVRWVGWGALRLVTLGRYRGGADDDRLSEGVIGLVIVIGVACVFYAVA